MTHTPNDPQELFARRTRLTQKHARERGRLDAGFVFAIANTGRELAHLPVASLNMMLAAPRAHSLTKLKKLRLRGLIDSAFIWFPTRESHAYYDRLMQECFRGALKTPRIVQEAVNEATILSFVSCRIANLGFWAYHLPRVGSYGSRPRRASARAGSLRR